MVEKCDICGKETDFLVDYFKLICQDCKLKYYTPKLEVEVKNNGNTK